MRCGDRSRPIACPISRSADSRGRMGARRRPFLPATCGNAGAHCPHVSKHYLGPGGEATECCTTACTSHGARIRPPTSLLKRCQDALPSTQPSKQHASVLDGSRLRRRFNVRPLRFSGKSLAARVVAHKCGLLHLFAYGMAGAQYFICRARGIRRSSVQACEHRLLLSPFGRSGSDGDRTAVPIFPHDGRCGGAPAG